MFKTSTDIDNWLNYKEISIILKSQNLQKQTKQIIIEWTVANIYQERYS